MICSAALPESDVSKIIMLQANFGDILKFGTLAAEVGCAKGGDFAHIVGWNTKSAPCIGGALGAPVVRLIYK